MFGPALEARANRLVEMFRERKILLATAESCTGGLIAGLVTAVPGSSDIFDCGFVTYSNDAKSHMIGVPAELIATRGAVSAEVARAMALGALAHSRAHVSVAVTAIAGPGGGSVAKPVGLVHCAAARRDASVMHRELRLGDIGREAVRLATVEAALDMAYEIAALSLP